MTAKKTTTRTDEHVAPDISVAAERVYDAECALHAAHQTHLDVWITAAANRLHTAIEAYLTAVAADPA